MGFYAPWSEGRCSVEREPILRGAKADAPWSVSRFSVERETPPLEGCFLLAAVWVKAPEVRKTTDGGETPGKITTITEAPRGRQNV